MIKKNIEATYEKMYAYEEAVKNSISIKTQLIFTATFALISTTIYLARFLDFSVKPEIAYIISFLIMSVVIIAAISTYFNCKAFSGSEFIRMPYAVKVKKYYDDQVQYNIDLEAYNAQVDFCEKISLINPVQETESFISNTYVECSTHNAFINERRSRWAFKAIAIFLMACIPLAIASLLFVVFDMDTSSPRKNFSIKDNYVGGEIASLKNLLSNSSKNNAITDLEKRTIILENMFSEKRMEKLSETKKATAGEKKPQPKAPVKPSAPPSRMLYDDINGDKYRSQK